MVAETGLHGLRQIFPFLMVRISLMAYGLIMQLTDKRGDYVFKLIQSEIVNSDPEDLLNNYTKMLYS